MESDSGRRGIPKSKPISARASVRGESQTKGDRLSWAGRGVYIHSSRGTNARGWGGRSKNSRGDGAKVDIGGVWS